MRRLTVTAAMLLLAAGCIPGNPGPKPTPTVSPSASPSPSVSASPSVSPSATPSVSPSSSPSASPSVSPSPQPGGFPNAATTGAPVETGLPSGPCSLGAGTFTGMLFDCDKLEVRSGTVIKNSVILGEVKGDPDPTKPGFVVEDSTIAGDGCQGAAAVGNSNFELRRVHVRGFNDGVRAEGRRVLVFDSLIEVCPLPDGHADGLQVCPHSAGCGGDTSTAGLVFDHNTVTHPKADSTGAVFVMGGSTPDYQITDNLLSGFAITVRLHAVGLFTGNRVVQDSGLHGEFDIGDVCDPSGPKPGMTWADNRLVTLGSDYALASVGAEVKCG